MRADALDRTDVTSPKQISMGHKHWLNRLLLNQLPRSHSTLRWRFSPRIFLERPYASKRINPDWLPKFESKMPDPKPRTPPIYRQKGYKMRHEQSSIIHKRTCPFPALRTCRYRLLSKHSRSIERSSWQWPLWRWTPDITFLFSDSVSDFWTIYWFR